MPRTHTVRSPRIHAGLLAALAACTCAQADPPDPLTPLAQCDTPAAIEWLVPWSAGDDDGAWLACDDGRVFWLELGEPALALEVRDPAPDDATPTPALHLEPAAETAPGVRWLTTSEPTPAVWDRLGVTLLELAPTAESGQTNTRVRAQRLLPQWSPLPPSDDPERGERVIAAAVARGQAWVLTSRDRLLDLSKTDGDAGRWDGLPARAVLWFDSSREPRLHALGERGGEWVVARFPTTGQAAATDPARLEVEALAPGALLTFLPTSTGFAAFTTAAAVRHDGPARRDRTEPDALLASAGLAAAARPPAGEHGPPDILYVDRAGRLQVWAADPARDVAIALPAPTEGTPPGAWRGLHTAPGRALLFSATRVVTVDLIARTARFDAAPADAEILAVLPDTTSPPAPPPTTTSPSAGAARDWVLLARGPRRCLAPQAAMTSLIPLDGDRADFRSALRCGADRLLVADARTLRLYRIAP